MRICLLNSANLLSVPVYLTHFWKENNILLSFTPQKLCFGSPQSSDFSIVSVDRERLAPLERNPGWKAWGTALLCSAADPCASAKETGERQPLADQSSRVGSELTRQRLGSADQRD